MWSPKFKKEEGWGIKEHFNLLKNISDREYLSHIPKMEEDPPPNI